MSEWFEWKEQDLKQLGVGDYELFDYLREGLTPHERDSKTTIPCPHYYHQYYDECLIFHSLEKIKEQARKEGIEKPHPMSGIHPLYYCFLNLNCYHKQDSNGLLYISYNDIGKLESKLEDDYTRLQEEMGCDPAKALHSWAFIGSFSEDELYTDIRMFLIEDKRAIFKQDKALEIREKFRTFLNQLKEGFPIEDFVFCLEGLEWTIKYEGKLLRGLRGKGFGFICYLVSNPHKEYNVVQLSEAVEGRHIESLESEKKKNRLEVEMTEETDKNGVRSGQMLDEKGKEELRTEYRTLRAEVEKAQNEKDFAYDPLYAQECQKKLEEFEKFYFGYFQPGGKVNPNVA